MYAYSDILQGLAFLVAGIFLFLAARGLKEFLTPFNDGNELIQRKNTAVSVSMSGYLFAVIIVLTGAYSGPETAFLEGLMAFAGYTMLGIVLLNIARWMTDKAMLRRFCNVTQLTDGKNLAVGFVECGAYIGTGLVVAGSIHGQGGGVVTAIVFFLITQILFLLFSILYERMTPYSIHDELERGNLAAGISFCGSLIAVGVILMRGTSGDFVSWPYNIGNLALDAGACFVLLPLVRWLVDKLVFGKVDLNQAIGSDQNVAIAVMETIMLISFAVMLTMMVDLHMPL